MLVHYYVPLETQNWATSIPHFQPQMGYIQVKVHFLETSDWDHVVIRSKYSKFSECNKIFGE